MNTVEHSDTAMREIFYSMEEGVEYVLNDFWFTEINRIRKENEWQCIEDKQRYKFSRKDDKLFVNGEFRFDFDGKQNIAFELVFAGDRAAVVFSFALQHSGLENLNKGTCEGKVVEIDGRKYKLTAV